MKKSRNSGKFRVMNVQFGNQILQIPVGPDGLVPKWAIVQRFQEVGDVSDINTTSDIILPSSCTPEQIAMWWADPSSCDIQGIDTEDSEVYDVSSVPSSKKSVQRKIGIVATSPQEQARIRRILSESFTAEELRAMASNGSFVISSLDDTGDVTGCYYRSQNGMKVPLIVIERGCTPDGIVHEVVHHARAVDDSREGILRSELDENPSLIKRLFSRSFRKKLGDEERRTVAETVVRTGVDPVQSGYYDNVPGMSPRTAYLQDRRILHGLPNEIPEDAIPKLKGKAARDAVLKGYAYSNIARSIVFSEKEDD